MQEYQSVSTDKRVWEFQTGVLDRRQDSLPGICPGTDYSGRNARDVRWGYGMPAQISAAEEETRISAAEEETRIPAAEEEMRIPAVQEDIRIPAAQEDIRIPAAEEEKAPTEIHGPVLPGCDAALLLPSVNWSEYLKYLLTVSAQALFCSPFGKTENTDFIKKLYLAYQSVIDYAYLKPKSPVSDAAAAYEKASKALADVLKALKFRSRTKPSPPTRHKASSGKKHTEDRVVRRYVSGRKFPVEAQTVLLLSELHAFLSVCGPLSGMPQYKSDSSEKYFDDSFVKEIHFLDRQFRTEDAKLFQFRKREDQPLFIRIPCLEDISQGDLSDCYVLAGLASIVHTDPGLIINAMRDEGNYVSVRFFTDTGEPVYIAVEKSAPTDKRQASDVYAKGCLWVQMIEKAYAIFRQKLSGQGSSPAFCDYKSISYGMGDEFIRHMTGMQFARSKPADNEYIFEMILDGLRRKQIITAGTGYDGALKRYGLAEGHAYSVLGAEVREGSRYILIRNPWGSGLQQSEYQYVEVDFFKEHFVLISGNYR